MNGILWALWILVIIGIAVWAFGGMHKKKLQRLREEASQKKLNEQDWESISKYAKLVMKAPQDVRTRLEPLIQILVDEKSWEPCGEFEKVTREMKVVVMAQAALLLVGRPHRFFAKLRSILLYPGAYTGKDQDGEEQTRLGESWESGSVILSWKSVQKGGEDLRDGHNVVIHEFAHQLDQENRHADGLPQLVDRSEVGQWAHTFSRAYEEFCKDLDAGRKTVMDPYGATNPAEFFSVGTECFFEKAEQLKEDYPDLYRELADYYGLDPARW